MGGPEPFLPLSLFRTTGRPTDREFATIPLRVGQLESVERPLDVGGWISAGRALERDERPRLQGLVDEGVMQDGRRVCGRRGEAMSKAAGWLAGWLAG